MKVGRNPAPRCREEEEEETPASPRTTQRLKNNWSSVSERAHLLHASDAGRSGRQVEEQEAETTLLLSFSCIFVKCKFLVIECKEVEGEEEETDFVEASEPAMMQLAGVNDVVRTADRAHGWMSTPPLLRNLHFFVFCKEPYYPPSSFFFCCCVCIRRP